ncbi:uncharacterized protein LOC132889620 [Neoarius graeffei]|uniref:uncharacterized protein LOC132889620 n=1 Tax=Neoarius graeffei TaxID=443677 RepID=UPI00298C78F3|nr:uncharacterized protein LOC132889620 [Neoarius graeffei]
MIERFIQQYPAIIAATVDDRIRKKDQFKRIQRVVDDDFNKMETFVQVAGLLYKMTTAMSSERRPTAGMVLPMMEKLRLHFTPSSDDSPFAANLKSAVQRDLQKRYKVTREQESLEEATVLDARFKTFCKEDVWDRLCDKISSTCDIKKEAMNDGEVKESREDEGEAKEVKPPRKMTALEEIFLDEDEVEITHVMPPIPVHVRVQNEITKYREMPKIKSSEDTVLFWRNNSNDLPLLSGASQTHLPCAPQL